MSERPKWMPRLSPSEWHFEPTFRQTGISAQIAVLEEFLREVATHYTNRTMESDWAEAKLTALRKELGE